MRGVVLKEWPACEGLCAFQRSAGPKGASPDAVNAGDGMRWGSELNLGPCRRVRP